MKVYCLEDQLRKDEDGQGVVKDGKPSTIFS